LNSKNAATEAKSSQIQKWPSNGQALQPQAIQP
jgi:hypothetical protein